MQPIWDIFIRVYHWLLVAGIGFAWWTIEQGGDWMEWHMYSGILVLSLVLFRVIWGFVGGGGYARFNQFVRSPSVTLRYARDLMRNKEAHYVGHNPMGGWAVIALLLFCAIQAGTGLFTTDDIAFDGPLNHLISSALASDITRFHKQFFNILLGMIVLHIAAILFHQLVRNEKLIQAMFSGKKPAENAVDIVTSKPLSIKNSLIFGAITAAIAAAVIWGLLSL